MPNRSARATRCWMQPSARDNGTTGLLTTPWWLRGPSGHVFCFGLGGIPGPTGPAVNAIGAPLPCARMRVRRNHVVTFCFIRSRSFSSMSFASSTGTWCVMS